MPALQRVEHVEPQEGAALHPEAFDDLEQHVGAGGAIAEEVEALVLLDVVVDTAFGDGQAHRLVHRLALGDLRRGDLLGRTGDRHGFEQRADLSRLGTLCLAHQAHAHRAVGQQLQRALGNETAHGLAHRHRAGAHLRRQLAHRQALARGHPPNHQRVAQRPVDLLLQGEPADGGETAGLRRGGARGGGGRGGWVGARHSLVSLRRRRRCSALPPCRQTSGAPAATARCGAIQAAPDPRTGLAACPMKAFVSVI